MYANIFRKIFLTAIIVAVAMHSRAQITPTDSVLMEILDSDVLLPPLMDSAIKNSGEVKRATNSVLVWKETSATNKKNIFSSLMFVTSYNYGTAGDLTTGKDNTSSNTYNSFRTNTGDRYNIGLNLQLPLTFLLTRKNAIHVSDLQAKMAEGEIESSKTYIRGEVIRMYQEMKLAQKLVMLTSKNKQAGFVNHSLAEKAFVQGNGDVETISRLHDIYIKAAIEVENSINHFQTNFLQLQSYAGVNLSDLILKVKLK